MTDVMERATLTLSDMRVYFEFAWLTGDARSNVNHNKQEWKCSTGFLDTQEKINRLGIPPVFTSEPRSDFIGDSGHLPFER